MDRKEAGLRVPNLMMLSLAYEQPIPRLGLYFSVSNQNSSPPLQNEPRAQIRVSSVEVGESGHNRSTIGPYQSRLQTLPQFRGEFQASLIWRRLTHTLIVG